MEMSCSPLLSCSWVDGDGPDRRSYFLIRGELNSTSSPGCGLVVRLVSYGGGENHLAVFPLEDRLGKWTVM
jgi:hypothetical protein